VSGELRPYFPDGGPHDPDLHPELARQRIERGLRSILVRLKRAGLTFVGLFVALAVYMIGFGGGSIIGSIFTFILAMAAIIMLSLLVMALPVRDRRRRRPHVEEEWKPRPVVDGGEAVRLDRLAAQTEEWLFARARALPSQAGSALDRIVFRLRDLQPSLSTVQSDSPLGGEARRLIGEHLPDLVTTYLSLPPGERTFHAESSRRLAESLDIVADQMDDLCERVRTDRLMGFEAERRFIESRYKDGDRLSLDRP
jgi:hypothetical protein